MRKRSCTRFRVRGATLRFRKRRRFFGKARYSEDRFPVIDFSRGGARFVNDQRLGVGREIVVEVHMPGFFPDGQGMEILGTVRWVASNPEASYRYQTGISFHPYGNGKNNNPPELLEQLKVIETAMGFENNAA